MFAKLKKKIEEENQTEIGKDFTSSTYNSPSRTGSRASSPSRISGTNTPKDGQSIKSSPAIPRRASFTFENHNSSPKMKMANAEELNVIINSKTEHIKKLEAKLSECSNVIKDHVRNKEKLEQELEKQQESLNVCLEKKDEEWKAKLQVLQKEKEMAESKLQEAEQMKNKIIQKQDDRDELEGFQTQELAKIKHMLMNCQQELQNSEKNVAELTSSLNSSNVKNEKLQEEIKVIKNQMEKDSKKRLKLEEDIQLNSSQLSKITELNKSLENDISKLNKDLNETTNKNAQLERLLNDLQDERDTLYHNHETQSKQSSKELSEKESHISYLEDRVGLLEKRLADQDLTGDDKEIALFAERNNLEQKLEETRQQLNNIKLTWSEKICGLEKQISHLNKKIAEDSVEMRRAEEEFTAKEKDLKDEITRFTQQVKSLEDDKEKLKRSLNDKTKELQSLEKKYEEDVRRLHEKKNKETQALKQKIISLQAENSTLQQHIKEKMKELENNSSEMYFVKQKMEDSSRTVQDLSVMVTNLRKELEERISTIKSLENILLSKDQECTGLNEELSLLKLSRNDVTEELENIQKSFSLEKEALSLRISNLEDAMASTSNEAKRYKKQLEELSLCCTEKTGHESDLRSLVAELEFQLNDRNKTIKLQQQRLGDMKKTLQRELKIQSVPSEMSNGEINDKDGFLSGFSIPQHLLNSGSGGSGNGHFVSQQLMNVVSENTKDPSTEDINFRYLKHVILKFMTSREYEAQHLIKAVSVLLHFTPDEERLIRDTLEWKMSWFGSKPKFGKGQLSKTISTT